MCTEVNVIRAGETIECVTVGQLAAALELQPEEVSADPDYCCLCNARWDELGARRATDEEGWPNPEYIIERPNCWVNPNRSDRPTCNDCLQVAENDPEP